MARAPNYAFSATLRPPLRLVQRDSSQGHHLGYPHAHITQRERSPRLRWIQRVPISHNEEVCFSYKHRFRTIVEFCESVWTHVWVFVVFMKSSRLLAIQVRSVFCGLPSRPKCHSYACEHHSTNWQAARYSLERVQNRGKCQKERNGLNKQNKQTNKQTHGRHSERYLGSNNWDSNDE